MKTTFTFLLVAAIAGLLIGDVADADAKPASKAKATKKVAAKQVAKKVETTAKKVVKAPAKPAAPAADAVEEEAQELDPLAAMLAKAASHGKAKKVDKKRKRASKNGGLKDLHKRAKAASSLDIRRGRTKRNMPVAEVVEHMGAQPLTAKQVSAYIRKHSGDLQYCHEYLTARGNSCDGDASLHLTVEPKGHVSKIVVAASGKDAKKLERCVYRAVKKWKFPAADAPTKVDYPLVFDTARSAAPDSE